jgi:CheY-like chemotaxis protein
MQPTYTKNKNVKKVLLADDDAIFLRVMTQYLDEAGFPHVIVQDGQQAWDYLQQYHDDFFVILADRIMPKLHGLELLANMQQTPWRDIPLILLTGESSKEERCEALAQGVYDFFYKPVSRELLLAVLKKVKKFNVNF